MLSYFKLKIQNRCVGDMRFFIVLLGILSAAPDVSSQWSPSVRILYILVPNGSTPCKVDFEDFVAFAMAFGSTPESPNWNVGADTNDDGIVNFPDFIAFASVFGLSALGTSGESCSEYLRRSIYVSGKVANSNEPFENVWVDAIKTEDAMSITWGKTDQFGSFAISGLDEGDYHMVPKRFGYVFEPDTLQISLGDSSLTLETFQGDLAFELVDVKVVQANIPVVGVEVSFLRTLAGQSAQGPWTGITDTSGVTAIRIPVLEGASDIGGTYLTRVTNVNTGDVLDSWNSVPIQTADTRRLVLSLGGDVEYVPEREYYFYFSSEHRVTLTASEERLRILFLENINEITKTSFLEELGLRDDGDGLFALKHTRGRSAVLEAVHLAKRSDLVTLVMPELKGEQYRYQRSDHLMIDFVDEATEGEITQFLDELGGTVIEIKDGYYAGYYEVEVYDLLSQDLFEISEIYRTHPLIITIRPDFEEGTILWTVTPD